MNYPFFIARRLSLSSSGRKKAPAVGVAIASVALSIAVMLASIAIVLGFKAEILIAAVGGGVFRIRIEYGRETFRNQSL